MSNYRKEQCETMLAALERVGVAGMTRRQFAELLGIKKGTHLNGLVKELVERDLAIVKFQPDQHNRLTYFYFPTSPAATEA